MTLGQAAKAILSIVLSAAIVGWCVHDCRQQQRCETLGGHVEKYDCETIYMTNSCGSGCWTTVPVTSCKWRCVGAPAESPR